MRKIIVGVVGLTLAAVAYANCFTNNVFTPDGKVIICTTCCYNGQCSTTCTQ